MKRAFSLIETMVALGLATLVGTGVVAAFQGALESQREARHEWIAFTLAQQRMDLLATMPRGAVELDENSAHPTPGLNSDVTCDDVPLGPRRLKVDPLGQPDTAGVHELCWKVNANHPMGNVKNIRVVASWPTRTGRGHVLLQTVR